MRVLPFDARYAPEIEAAVHRLRSDIAIDESGTFTDYIKPDMRDESRTGTLYLVLIEEHDMIRHVPLSELPRRIAAGER